VGMGNRYASSCLVQGLHPLGVGINLERYMEG